MHTPSDRDVAFERALRAAVRRNDGDSSGPCPDANTLAAWADRALTREVTALVESHMSVCPRCQSILAALSRMDGSNATPAPSLWRQWRLQWLVPFAAAATAVALWVSGPDQPVQQTGAISDVGDELAGATVSGNQPAPAPPLAPDSPTPARDAAAPAPAPEAYSVGRAAPQTQLADAVERREQALGSSADASRDVAGLAANQVTPPPTPSAPPPPPTATAEASPPLAIGARARAAELSATPAVFIVSPGSTVRWRIVGGQRIERSTSAGATWEATTGAPATRLIAGSAPSDRVCWVVGSAGAIRRTTDGLAFTPLPFPEVVDLVAVRATSDSTADVTTSDGRTYRTVDGGGSWNRVAP